ncbi:putative sterol 3-beta-glucosyltransferase [Helianthus annuus]|nr:putative sterol 3-beta-glucosyltransferase [Helianthus annuus]
MPWTPTSEFPHPLSRVKQPAGYRPSYQIVDSLIWLGIRDMINDFRKKKLKLRPVACHIFKWLSSRKVICMHSFLYIISSVKAGLGYSKTPVFCLMITPSIFSF